MPNSQLSSPVQTDPQLAALDLLASAVLLVNTAGQITYANAAAENLLDSSLKSMQGRTLYALFLNAEELVHLCEQALAHHHGTFQLTDEAIDAPVTALGEALKEAKIPPERFAALKPGQVYEV